MSNSVWQYFIDIKIPGSETKRVAITGETTVGGDKQAGLPIEDQGLPPLAFKLNLSDDILTITCLHQEKNWTLSGQALEKDKMHILNPEDNISLGEVVLQVVRKRNQQGPQVDETREMKSPLVTQTEPEPGPKPKEDSNGPKPKTQHKPVIKATIAKVEENDYGLPGFITRFLSLIICLALAFFLNNQLLPATGLDVHLNQELIAVGENLIDYARDHWMDKNSMPIDTGVLDQMVEQGKHTLKNYVEIVRFLIVFPLLDLFFHLLLGTSLPLFFCGVTDRGGIVGTRIRAAFRSVIGNLGLPFLVYDLPIVFGKRSLKEVLTGSRLHYQSQLLKYLIPTLFLLSPLAAIHFLDIKKPKIFKQLATQTQLYYNKLEPQDEEESTSLRYNSMAYFLQVNKKLNQDIIRIPSIEVSKEGINPGMIFMNLKRDAVVHSKVVKKIDLLPFITPSTPQDLTGPDLDKSSEHMTKMIEDSLSISWKNLPRFILQKKISLIKYLELRHKIMSSLKINEPKLAVTLTSEKEDVFSTFGGTKNKFFVLLPRGKTLFLYQFVDQRAKGGATLKAVSNITPKAMAKFPGSANPGDWKDYFQDANNKPYIILDVLTNLGQSPLEDDIMHDIVMYYKDLADQVTKTGNKKLSDILIDEFKLMDKSFKNLLKEVPQEYREKIEELNISLNRIQKSLEEAKAIIEQEPTQSPDSTTSSIFPSRRSGYWGRGQSEIDCGLACGRS